MPHYRPTLQCHKKERGAYMLQKQIKYSLKNVNYYMNVQKQQGRHSRHEFKYIKVVILNLNAVIEEKQILRKKLPKLKHTYHLRNTCTYTHPSLPEKYSILKFEDYDI